MKTESLAPSAINYLKDAAMLPVRITEASIWQINDSIRSLTTPMAASTLRMSSSLYSREVETILAEALEGDHPLIKSMHAMRSTDHRKTKRDLDRNRKNHHACRVAQSKAEKMAFTTGQKLSECLGRLTPEFGLTASA